MTALTYSHFQTGKLQPSEAACLCPGKNVWLNELKTAVTASFTHTAIAASQSAIGFDGAIASFLHTAIAASQSAIGFDGAIGLTLLNSLNQSDRVLWTGDRFVHLSSGSDRSSSKCDRIWLGDRLIDPHCDRSPSKCDRV